jgi:hypothetical protein
LKAFEESLRFRRVLLAQEPGNVQRLKMRGCRYGGIATCQALSYGIQRLRSSMLLRRL